MHSKIVLERSYRTIFSTNLVSLAPVTYKKEPHMTYIWVFQVTFILTPIYEVIHLKIDLKRSRTSLLSTDLDFLAPITYKKTSHVTYIRVFEWPPFWPSLRGHALQNWPTQVLNNHILCKFSFPWPQFPIKRYPIFEFSIYLHFDLNLWGHTSQNWPPKIPNIIIDYKFGLPSTNYL